MVAVQCRIGGLLGGHMLCAPQVKFICRLNCRGCRRRQSPPKEDSRIEYNGLPPLIIVFSISEVYTRQSIGHNLVEILTSMPSQLGNPIVTSFNATQSLPTYTLRCPEKP
jgi:hypothetical protein